ncbi:MAG TPA: exonuclease subunit SbcD [Cytophagales bacterium]|nr:exonuclease subunit SbcD [Cytophagales bacterium]
MRILHTADWHLGKRLETFSRLEEQKEVLEEICEIADREKVDAVIIAGDLFDTYNPSSEAVELFYRTLKKISNGGKRLVFAIAGNHDSPERIEAPDVLARECGIVFAGYPNSLIQPCQLGSGICIVKSDEGFAEIKLPDFQYTLRIVFTPYANEFRLKTFISHENPDEEYRTILTERWKILSEKYCDPQGVNILMAHLYVMKKDENPPEEPEDEKPILHVGGAQAVFSENFPDQIQYVALGHIHRKQTIDKNPCPIAYSGSPLAYSFGEANQDKFIKVIEAEPGKPVSSKSIKLKSGKKLLRKKFKDILQAADWLKENQEALVEITIVTEKFLSGEDKKLLMGSHEGIINIIPEVTDKTFLESLSSRTIDLSKSNEELFKEYFQFRYESLPNERLLKLFKEVQAEEDEN